MDAARVLCEARRRAGLTQRALAAAAGVPQSMVARIERGTVTPRVDTLDRLLEACGEGLYALQRIGLGVDRTLAEGQLTMSMDERARRGVDAARGVYRFASGFQRSAGMVRENPKHPTDVVPILEILLHHGVRFVVIGGMAATAQGSPSVTFDLDICYARDGDNISRLVAALRELGASLRGAPADAPDVVDERFIRNGLNFTFATLHGDLDCLGEPAGTNGYPDLVRNATVGGIGGRDVHVAAVADLIRMKRAAGRPKDRAHLEELGALQEILDERARRERRRGDEPAT